MQLVIDFDPSTPIASVIIAIKEKLKEQYDMENIQSVKLIYRGYVLDESKTLFNVELEENNE